MSRKTLNETIPNWMSNGIFSKLNNLDVPWKNDVSARVLDMKYHGNNSGMKKISPLLEALSNNEIISDANLTELSTILFEIYGLPWTKLYATMSLEYNPIENYSMVETEEVDGTNTGTVETDNNVVYGKRSDVNETSADTGTVSDNTSLSKNTKETTTNNLSNTDVGTDTKVSQDSVYGFDSVDAVNTDKTQDNLTTNVTHQQTGTVEVANSGTDTNTSTRTDDLHHTKSYTDTASGSDTASETRTDDLANHTERTLTRSGNIGVTTSQQMIESERQLWLWKYFDVVFKDVDSLLTIAIY